MNITPIIEESFGQYSGAVLQSRALVDVRDCLKPSARQIFYCLYTDKFIHTKPFKKTLKGIGSAMRMYIHGDSSCEGVIMRAGQPFAMRYPLVEVEGSYGNLMETGNWAAPRYTASRLSELSSKLFSDIEKNTIDEWRDNYDDTEKYPAVLPTKGFYNIVNGTMGIGVALASSIPAFNLKEVNEALIKLLWNPDIDFEEIYCAPDFPTGALLLNEEEVKESLRNGTGKACKLRSVIEYDSKDRCLIVTEIPYGVYTNTICGQLEQILDSDENPGIDRFNDLTAATPNIKIYLTKYANPSKVLRYLLKNTSLQFHYGINMTMLEDGRYPKVFGWKDALKAYLTHQAFVYRRGFLYDLNKIEARLFIIEGLKKAIDAIDDVVKAIKSAPSTAEANLALQKLLNIQEIQAKAILDLKLSRLTKLDVNKLIDEQKQLEVEAERIRKILVDEVLFNKEIEKDLRATAEKFGDTRRTKILNVEKEEDEPLEEKQLSLTFTNEGAVFVNETSTLYSQRRGGIGSKFKLDPGEYIVDNIVGKNTDTILFFGSQGNFYCLKMEDFVVEQKQYLNSLIEFKEGEELRAGAVLNSTNQKEFVLFVTKKGFLKKSNLLKYNLKVKRGSKAINLEENDEIVSVDFINDEDYGILTNNGLFSIITTKDVNPVGRIARGVIGIRLKGDDFVSAGHIIPKQTKSILTVTTDGFASHSLIEEYNVTARGAKGLKVQKEKNTVDFLTITDNSDIMITSNAAKIVVKLKEFPIAHRGAIGVKTIKLKDNERIIRLAKI